MRNSRIGRDLRPQVTEWLGREHDRLDAHLAGLLLQTVWGAEPELQREFQGYRSELVRHLQQVERRLFSMLASLDESTRTMEGLEWQSHARDLQHVFTAIDREVSQRKRAGLYAHFDELRRVLRRHRRHEERLLALLALPPMEMPEVAEAFL